MAQKDQRILLAMVCQICKKRNYITSKNKTEMKEQLVLKKYCNRCRKHTEHKETDKLD